MSQYKEYSKPVVGNPGCTYSNLARTYGNGSRQSMMNNVPSMATYTVPKLCHNGSGPSYPPRYDTLTHGQSAMCGGYFSMKGAYPHADCASCDAEYTQRPCNGHVDCSASPSVKEEYCHR